MITTFSAKNVDKQNGLVSPNVTRIVISCVITTHFLLFACDLTPSTSFSWDFRCECHKKEMSGDVKSASPHMEEVTTNDDVLAHECEHAGGWFAKPFEVFQESL